MISVSIGRDHENKKCNRLSLATWNIGLEEKQSAERVQHIIDAILQCDVDIIGIQEAWGGPQMLRTIYQSVKTKYPNFAVVDDNMRDYISADNVANQVYKPACPASNITNFEICFFQKCITLSGVPQLLCAINNCTAQFVTLYKNPVCWACIFDRYITYQDPLGLNYCGAVNLPQYLGSSPGITPNSTDAPWNNTIGLMILSKEEYPLNKIKGAAFSEYFIAIRGYIIVTTNDQDLIISNTHLATVNLALPHPPAHTFLNNNYGSWNAENLGQIQELESNVWSLVQNANDKKQSAVMLGDYNMGIADFAYNTADIAPQSWYYIHNLTDTDGEPRWCDDYTQQHNLCTGCRDNLVVPYTTQYIFDHIFTHGPLFFQSNLFTKRIFDELIEIVYNNTNVTTSLSDHYGINHITIC